MTNGQNGREGLGSKIAKNLIWLLKGMLIGAGAILPGVSGGVLAVSLGVYRPMMATISHPKDNLPRYWRMFLPMLAGWFLGFVVLAKVIDSVFSADTNVAICLFTGLVAGSLPQLFLEADKQGSRRGDWVGFTLTLMIVTVCFMAFGGTETGFDIQPNLFWFFLCGGLWGLSLVIPGMTSSSVLIWLGLFQPMTAGISSFDPAVLVPFVLGIVTVVVLTARLVNAFFEKHHGLAYRMILAFVLASSLGIMPSAFSGFREAALCAAVFAAGFAGAWAMDRYGKNPEREAS